MLLSGAGCGRRRSRKKVAGFCKNFIALNRLNRRLLQLFHWIIRSLFPTDNSDGSIKGRKEARRQNFYVSSFPPPSHLHLRLRKHTSPRERARASAKRERRSGSLFGLTSPTKGEGRESFAWNGHIKIMQSQREKFERNRGLLGGKATDSQKELAFEVHWLVAPCKHYSGTSNC